MWYVLTGEDCDFWERLPPSDWNTAFLHIISEDKYLALTIPLSAPKPYAVSNGRRFQGRTTSGGWERYLLPFGIPRAVTPRFVAEVIAWAEGTDSNKRSEPQDWGGELQY